MRWSAVARPGCTPAISIGSPEKAGGVASRSARGGIKTSSSSLIPPDPLLGVPCQKNFVVVITDGEPTKDDFDTTSASTDQGFDDFQDLIGDYAPGETEEPTSGPDCTGGSGWECGRYLDDIAKFMQDNDFRPDMQIAKPDAVDTVVVQNTRFTVEHLRALAWL